MLDRFVSRPRHDARAPHLRTWLAALVLLPLLPVVALALAQALQDPGDERLPLVLAIGLACAVLGLLLALQVERRVARPLQRLAQGHALTPGVATVREVQALAATLAAAAGRESATRERLQARAARWEALVAACPVALAWTEDHQIRQSGQNPAMDRLLGEDPAASQVRLLANGRELPAEHWPLRRTAATGEPVSGLPLQLLRPGQPRRQLLAHAHPAGAAGAVLALVDISAHHQSQARRSAADERQRDRLRLLQRTHEAIGAGVFHHEFAQDRLHWSPSLCRLFGIGAREAVGPLSVWFGHVDEADRARVEREFWTACALRRPRLVLHYAVRQRDGQLRRLTSRLALRYDGEDRALEMSGLTLDEDGFDEPASGAGDPAFRRALDHVLRTPLGALASAADVLALAPPGSPSAQEARDVIARQTAVLGELAAQWLSEPAAAPVSTLEPAPPQAGLQVLLVHRGGQALAALQARLEQQGHRVTAAADGTEGLHQLLQLQPEVSMVEVALPGPSGLELARQARAAGYAGRLVALWAGPPAPAGTDSALAAGFDACLALPADGARLHACLGGAIA